MWAVLLAAAVGAPHVVFLSVDTLRADHLGCYGYSLNTSPNIDRLAEQSLVFEDCVCDVPLTNPSFGAMFTSRFPRMTGAVRNGIPMPPDVPTVAEEFQKAGYQTFCVQSNWTLKRDLSGLDRGFAVYEDNFHKKRWGLLKSERYADEVTETALKLLSEVDPGRPFFCWIHYSDPHAPYRFHRGFNPHGKMRRKFSREARVRIRYDSEVAFMDHHLGRLLDALPRENTYIVFVADHGESLFEHDYLGHGRRIYQPGVHIPFMVHGPGIEPGRTSLPAQGIDVGPTLLGLADLPAVPGMLGMNLLAEVVPSSRVRVLEAYGGAVPRVPGARAILAELPPVRQGAILDGWKLILNDREVELFCLARDPGELKNAAPAMPEWAAELRGVVEAWDAQTPRGDAEAATLKPEDVRALEAAGYL